MGKKLILILAFFMVFALFSGCNDKDNVTTTPTNTEGTAVESAQPTSTPEPDTPYNFAVGNFEVDTNGLPTGNYEYELPISTTDEVLTFWTTCYTPQWLPPDTQLGEMPGAVQFEEKNRRQH